MKTKKLVTAVAVVLVLCMTVAGSLAWLFDTTDEVVNTFTVGHVDIKLAETTTNYKMIPGETIAKDPEVTVEAGSEASWVFVKAEPSNNLATYIDYTIAGGWTNLDGVDNVFYREVAASDADQAFAVLANDQVTVKDTVTNADMTAAETDKPTLTFKAYAIQKSGFDTAAAAWAEVSK